MSFFPVQASTRPCASIIATWRTSRMNDSPSGPYDGSTKDCVATAPMPASAQATIGPTENQCDCTATPNSPVAGSRATIENVCTGRAGTAGVSDATVDTENTSETNTRA